MTRERSPEMEAFVAEAKAVGILQAFERCGYLPSRLRLQSGEYVGPCPACGGKDKFALNHAKNAFFCRNNEGGNGIDLAQHLVGLEFLDACELLTGREHPGRAGQDARERAVRAAEARERVAAQAARAAEGDARRAAEENSYRDAERARCLAIWSDSRRFGACDGEGAYAYLKRRGLGSAGAHVDPHYLRTHPRLGYFAKPERGPSIAIHYGPAMVGLFAVPGADRWTPIGIHQTWIDLDAAPKFRPALVHPETGEILPAKKMRGSKLGGVIPLIGRLSTAVRMVAGEGIETVLGFAAFEGFREDTFYCAAGDLGNLCGKAAQGSRVTVPGAFRVVKGGARKKLQVPGSEPDMDARCMPVPAGIVELVLLGDGDSEPVMTRAALKRGTARHAAPGRTVRAMFAPAGGDWADVAREI